MARTPSNMMPLGTPAPYFELYDVVSLNQFSIHEVKGEKGLLVMFICNHCPFVVHINHVLSKIGHKYQKEGIGIIAISSNDIVNYPQDHPELMKEVAKKENYNFPYCYDETQEVAKAYDAACTPDFFLFDAALKLVYRGQLDDSRPGNGVPVTGKCLTDAMDALINETAVNPNQKPSIGCNIKWKAS